MKALINASPNTLTAPAPHCAAPASAGHSTRTPSTALGMGCSHAPTAGAESSSGCGTSSGPTDVPGPTGAPTTKVTRGSALLSDASGNDVYKQRRVDGGWSRKSEIVPTPNCARASPNAKEYAALFAVVFSAATTCRTTGVESTLPAVPESTIVSPAAPVTGMLVVPTAIREMDRL